MPLWQPGESGNPSGWPKGRQRGPRRRKPPLSRAALRNLYRNSPNGLRYADVIMRKLIDLATEGDIKAIHELIMAVDGKLVPPRPRASGSGPGGPTELVLKDATALADPTQPDFAGPSAAPPNVPPPPAHP